MGAYRKKPVVVEARQLTRENGHQLLAWIEAGKQYIAAGGLPDGLKILTLEGPMKADFGDWIIRGVQGEFYPCKPRIFAETYEPAEDIPVTPIGYQGPAQHTHNAACDGFHEPGQCPDAGWLEQVTASVLADRTVPEAVNEQLVSRDGTGTVYVMAPKHAMTRAQALSQAAWLVALADDDDEFGSVLRAVRST